MTLTTTTSNLISVIITAAGSSTRIGGGIKKEYLPFQDGTVISTCIKTFLQTLLPNQKLINFVITTPVGGIENSKKAVFSDSEIKSLLEKNKMQLQFVEGSSTRQSSVFNGLKEISKNINKTFANNCNSENQQNHIVIIHDGARPFISSKTIIDSVEAALEFGASVPGITPTDTQKQITKDGFIEKHLERKSLVAVQTPQCFEFNKLFQAHQKAILDNKEYTDDTEIWGKYCGNVKVVPGDSNNIKITYPSDLERLKND